MNALFHRKVTARSGDLMPGHIEDLNDFQVDVWPSAEEGEARRAQEIAEMYTVLFNHPSYRALRSLIHGTWETYEQLVTDGDGYVNFTGFKGGYTLTTDGREDARIVYRSEVPLGAVITGAVYLNDRQLYEAETLEECIKGDIYAPSWETEYSIYKRKRRRQKPRRKLRPG